MVFNNEGVPRNLINIVDDDQAVEPSALDEVKKALKELKNSKAVEIVRD